MNDIFSEVQSCQLCKDRFALTKTRHAPRPVIQGSSSAKVLIAGQAPGLRVYQSGRPFDDPSGDRLRAWLGVEKDEFYDADIFEIVPMAFCFPGYNDKGHDLAPPKQCAQTWRSKVLEQFVNVELTLLVGTHAQAWHLNDTQRLYDRIEKWRDYLPRFFVLPHPSWRNTAWLNKNPWFDQDVLPELRRRIGKVLR